jgi:hypothetical protein
MITDLKSIFKDHKPIIEYKGMRRAVLILKGRLGYETIIFMLPSGARLIGNPVTSTFVKYKNKKMYKTTVEVLLSSTCKPFYYPFKILSKDEIKTKRNKNYKLIIP